MRNFRDGPRWVRGVVMETLGPLTYLIQTPDGSLWKRHLDQIRDGSKVSESDQTHDQDCDISVPSAVATSPTPTPVPSSETITDTGQSTAVDLPPNDTTIEPKSTRYPTRNRQPPDRLYGTLQH